MLTKEQISSLDDTALYSVGERKFQAKELLKAYRNTPEGLKDRFILENKGIFSSLLEEDPTGPSATTGSSPDAIAPYMGEGINTKLKDIDLSQEPSAVRVYNPSKKELNKGLKRNTYDYYTAYTGNELKPENLSNFVESTPIKGGPTEYGLLKVLDRLPDEKPKAYNIRIAEIARNLGYDVPDTDPDYISIRGQLAKDLMDQQIIESRKLAMQDEDQGPAAFITSTLLPRTYEDVINNRVDSDGIDPRSLGLDVAENAAMFIPNPISYGAKVIKPIARIASKAGPLVKKIGNAVSYLGNNAIVPVSFEGLDASVYDENSNPRSEFMPGQAAIGTAVNATAPRALNIGLEGTGKMFSLIKGGEKPGAYKTAVDKYKEFQDFKTNQNLSDAYTRKGADIYGKYNIGPKQAGAVKNIEALNRSDKELRALGLSPEEKMTAQNMARSERYAKRMRDDPSIAVVRDPFVENAKLQEMIRRGKTEEAAQIMTDNTGNKYTYYKLPKDQPTGLATVGVTTGEMLENTGVPRMTIGEGGRELDPLEINKAFYAYKPDRIPYDVEKKWQAYAAIVPGADAWLKNKAGRSNVVKQAGGALAGRFGATGDLSKTIDEYSLDPSGIPYESVPDTSYYQEDSTARKNPYIIKYILPASK